MDRRCLHLIRGLQTVGKIVHSTSRGGYRRLLDGSVILLRHGRHLSHFYRVVGVLRRHLNGLVLARGQVCVHDDSSVGRGSAGVGSHAGSSELLPLADVHGGLASETHGPDRARGREKALLNLMQLALLILHLLRLCEYFDVIINRTTHDSVNI